jgi:hypothetical protein
MATPRAIVIELFGVPRLLAGRYSLQAEGSNLADIVAELGAICPSLVGPVIDRDTGWLCPGYVFVVGDRFTTNRESQLDASTPVLLVSSAAGG